MRAFPVAAVALACLLPAQLGAQAEDDVVAALGELRSAVSSLPPELSSASLRRATQWLVGRPATASFNPRDVSPEYTRSLRRAAELLRGRPSRVVVRDVTAELEDKVEHCRRLGIGMGGLITLRVNTLRNGRAISNLRVQALLKIYEYVQRSEPRSFLRLSSPTQMDLEPGRYWVWAVDPATMTASERVLVRVTGKRELVLDLTVP